MSVRHLLAASVPPADTAIAADVLTLSSGRVGAIVATLLGLAGVAVGGRALARPLGRTGTGIGTGSVRTGAVAALAAGLIAMALGGTVVATSDGSLGTGNGLGGAFVALIVGLIASALGALALTRSTRRRTA
ncbi:DUF6223 family protein [Streptomyces gardneri]|uniref:DUF6223 family protein n=1 Tax=Streptomyces gardneri TaxID=66892 RepID=UPI0035D959B9